MIRPHILRRLKKKSFPTAPDKIEKCVMIPLEGRAEEAYDAHVQRLKFMLEKRQGCQYPVKVLAELHLRQLCCDPALIYQDYQEGARRAKMELCMELLNNAVNSGHKVLLFPSSPDAWD